MVIWLQGCKLGCEGCNEPELCDTKGGSLISVEQMKKNIRARARIVHNVVFTGGEPLFQKGAVEELAKFSHVLGLKTWLYTGFVFEKLESSLLEHFDVVIDGKYQKSKKGTPKHGYGGSLNQKKYYKGVLTGKWLCL